MCVCPRVCPGSPREARGRRDVSENEKPCVAHDVCGLGVRDASSGDCCGCSQRRPHTPQYLKPEAIHQALSSNSFGILQGCLLHLRSSPPAGAFGWDAWCNAKRHRQQQTYRRTRLGMFRSKKEGLGRMQGGLYAG